MNAQNRWQNTGRYFKEVASEIFQNNNKYKYNVIINTNK